MPRGTAARVRYPTFGLEELPPVTRCILVFTGVLSLCCRVGFLDMSRLLFWYPFIFQKFQVWRLVTGMFLLNLNGSTAFFSLITLHRVVHNTRLLERTDFQGRTADLVWMLVLYAGAASVAAYCMTEAFPIVAVSMSVMYYAARKRPSAQVSIWGVSMTVMQSVWVTLGLAFILYQPWMLMLSGVGIGHAYFLLEDVAPRVYGWRLIRTPRFLYKCMHPSLNTNTTAGRELAAAHTRTHAFSGRGQKLQ